MLVPSIRPLLGCCRSRLAWPRRRWSSSTTPPKPTWPKSPLASRPTATISRAASPATAGTEELTADGIEAALARFRGPGQQVPPMHAAIKVGGQKLYDLARRGEEIPRSPRPVTFHDLEMLEWSPPAATLLVDCSKGTYIRALARDLGAALGTGAYLSNLVRLRAGPFHLCQASHHRRADARSSSPGPGPGSPCTPIFRCRRGRRSSSTRTTPAAGDRAHRSLPIAGQCLRPHPGL